MSCPNRINQISVSIQREYVRVLGVIVLIAAVFKAYYFAIDGELRLFGFSSHVIIILLIVSETAVALLLIFAGQRWWCWWLAVTVFSALLAVAARESSIGMRSCGCFGRIEVSPWMTGTLDLLALIGLLITGKHVNRGGKRAFSQNWIWIVGSLSMVVVGWTIAARLRRDAAADLGAGEASNGVFVLRPHSWIGKPFPLVRNLDIKSGFPTGHWLLLIYRGDCEHCKRAIKLYASIANRYKDIPYLKTALVEIPPFVLGSREKLVPGVVFGTLSNNYEWIAHTPIMVEIVDGFTVDALEGEEAEVPPQRFSEFMNP